MEMTVAEKVRLVAQRKGIKLYVLAERTGQSRQNLSNKLGNDDFTERQMRELAGALDCDLQINFIDRETGETI